VETAIDVPQNIGFELKLKDLRHVVHGRVEDGDLNIVAVEYIMDRRFDSSTAPHSRGAGFDEDLEAECLAEDRHGLVKIGVIISQIKQVAAPQIDPVDLLQNLRDDVLDVPRRGQEAGEIGTFAIVVKMEAGDTAKAGRLRHDEACQSADRHPEFRVPPARVVSGIADEGQLWVHTEPNSGLRRNPAAKAAPLGERVKGEIIETPAELLQGFPLDQRTYQVQRTGAAT